MNASDQITIVEPVIKIPACRSASPKKRNTLKRKSSRHTRIVNLTMSPNDANQSAGTANQLISAPRSPGASPKASA